MKSIIRFSALALFFAFLFQSCSKEEFSVSTDDSVEANKVQPVIDMPLGGPPFSVDIESDWATLWNKDAKDLKQAGLSLCLTTTCGFVQPIALDCFDIEFENTLIPHPSFNGLKFQKLRITNMSWSYTGGNIGLWGYWQCVGDPITATIADVGGCELGCITVPGPSASGSWPANNTIDIDLQEIVDYMNDGTCY